MSYCLIPFAQGLYFSLQPSDETESDTSSTLYTAIPKLGLVPEFSDQFQVPQLTDGDGNALQDIPFDVFPGSPSIDDFGMIAFKGNYAVEGVGMTGVCEHSLLDCRCYSVELTCITCLTHLST
jgi:hypothetical protein